MGPGPRVEAGSAAVRRRLLATARAAEQSNCPTGWPRAAACRRPEAPAPSRGVETRQSPRGPAPSAACNGGESGKHSSYPTLLRLPTEASGPAPIVAGNSPGPPTQSHAAIAPTRAKRAWSMPAPSCGGECADVLRTLPKRENKRTLYAEPWLAQERCCLLACQQCKVTLV